LSRLGPFCAVAAQSVKVRERAPVTCEGGAPVAHRWRTKTGVAMGTLRVVVDGSDVASWGRLRGSHHVPTRRGTAMPTCTRSPSRWPTTLATSPARSGGSSRWRNSDRP
jgi:hypothetical protein